ncbi:unnamed protein product, partial [Polarella glacialis]
MLGAEDLRYLECVLRVRGVRTVRALAILHPNERSIIVVKARDLWELLGVFTSSLQSSLNNLFSAEVLPIGAITSSSAADVPFQPGCVGFGNNAASKNSSPDQNCFPLLAETAAPILLIPAVPLILELPPPLHDDTNLVQSVSAALESAREIVGLLRFNECIRRLLISDQMAASSAFEAAEADVERSLNAHLVLGTRPEASAA